MTGVVDDEVDGAEGVDGRLRDGHAPLGGGHRVVAGHGLAAGGGDLGHGGVGRAAGRPGAVGVPAEVVDHDPRPPAGQLQGVGLAQAAAGAGHDGHPSVECDGHCPAPFVDGVILGETMGRP